jgi:uncharacterized protein (TIGR02246 family)
MLYEEDPMKCLTAVFAFATAFVVAPAFQAQTGTDPTLDRLVADFQAAFNAKDAAKVASFYAEDGVVMPPNQPMVKGRSAIQARLEKDLKGMNEENIKVKITPTHSAITGDSAHDVGTVEVTLPDGKVINEKYVVLYKRVGGEWKIAYDIWNSDTSPPPQK